MIFHSTTIDVQLAASPHTAVSCLPGVRSGKKLTKVLLLDGYSTRTLACVRSWGKKGIPFAVGGETRWDMSLLSRYSKENFMYKSPKRDLSKFIREVNHRCQEFGADCVFPTSEAAIMVCSRY